MTAASLGGYTCTITVRQSQSQFFHSTSRGQDFEDGIKIRLISCKLSFCKNLANLRAGGVNTRFNEKHDYCRIISV